MSVGLVFVQFAFYGGVSFLFIGAFSYVVLSGKREVEPSFSASCLNILGAIGLAIIATILVLVAIAAIAVRDSSNSHPMPQNTQKIQ